jgi:hypothetical protein
MRLGDNLVHLGCGEGPAGCRVDIAHSSQTQNGCGGGFIIWGFQD